MICIEHYIGVNLIKPLPVCFHHTCLFHTNISVMKAAIILTVFFIFLLVKKVLKEKRLDFKILDAFVKRRNAINFWYLEISLDLWQFSTNAKNFLVNLF